MDEKYLTVTEFADRFGMNPSAVQQLLQRDSQLPETERRLPGAHNSNPANPRRGEWRIPLAAADAFTKSPRGRKKG